MPSIRTHFNLTSLLVIVTTFILFALALLTGGVTHDLLLEAGVFLVSVKLVVASYRSSVVAYDTKAKLEAISAAVERVERTLEMQLEGRLEPRGKLSGGV